MIATDTQNPTNCSAGFCYWEILALDSSLWCYQQKREFRKDRILATFYFKLFYNPNK